MSSSEFVATRSVASSRLRIVTAGLLCATALAGCSADLGRIDLANSGVKPENSRQRTALLPSEPMRRSVGGPVESEPAPPPPTTPYSYNPAPYQPPGSTTAPVRQAGLPEPVSREPEARRLPEPSRRDSGKSAARPTTSIADPSPAPIRGGHVIEVQPGDTVYGLAKKHRVSISELMTANQLQTPMIKPGQKLVVPAGRRQSPARRAEEVAAAPSTTPPAASGRRAPEPLAPAASIAPSAPVAPIATEAPAGWTGTHTVTARDNLYGIAKRYSVKVSELQAANGITDPSKMRAGTVLKVPATSAARAPATAASEPVAPPANMPRPTIINAGEKPEPTSPPERVAVAAPQSPTLSDATPEPTPRQKAHAGTAKFRWPARGKVVASFGPRSDNTHNDGINILVPQGTSVVAAENGTVAYAGSELKGYGNLVLIRHEGNWVSAYAHNETLLVKRGDKVERGQAIAKAGKTGAVEQPQVHFELRQGSKPIDPMPHLEK